MSQEIQLLLGPLTPSAPCGIDLEDSQTLAKFDAFRIFGSDVRLPADTDWRAVRDSASEALQQSKDFRLLAHYGAAMLHLEGLDPFSEILGIAAAWLRDQFDTVFPPIDGDGILRRNALACFADRMAVVDAVRRAPFISHRQLGSYSLRAVELASGKLPATESDTNVPSRGEIDAVLEGTPVEQLQATTAMLDAAVAAIRDITATMQTKISVDAGPDLTALLTPLTRMQKILAEHLAHRSGAGETAPVSTNGAEEPTSVTQATPLAVGNIQSRQDAIRAIDAVATYFRKNEPSSPIPLLLDRAKRLVSKSFLEVLEDIAPDSLAQARAAGGIKADQN